MLENGQKLQLLPSKQFPVWSRLYGRFLLEPGPAVGSNAYVAPVIQPTTDADKLLQRLTVQRMTAITITGTGQVTPFTVPKGKRWTVYIIRIKRSGGTWTFNNYQFIDPVGLGFEVHEFAAEATSLLWELTNPIALDEQWDIRVNVDSESVNGDMNGECLVLEEDAF